MKRIASFSRLGHLLSLGWMLGAAAGWDAAAGEINIMKTNLVDRWITNLIGIQMPMNRFVNDYHTNWVEVVRTNAVQVYTTNTTVKFATNVIVVDLVQTNQVTVCRTNWHPLNLTNWTTVLVLRTNWVSVPITNYVQIDAPANSEVRMEPAPPKRPPEGAARQDTVLPVLAAKQADAVEIHATLSAAATTNNQYLVQLRARWKGDPDLPLRVEQWRVERLDGSVLSFGQDPVFQRGLPAGDYKVQVKVQKDAASPLMTVKGTLAVPGA